MNDEAVYRTAPATPGLLKSRKSKKVRNLKMQEIRKSRKSEKMIKSQSTNRGINKKNQYQQGLGWDLWSCLFCKWFYLVVSILNVISLCNKAQDSVHLSVAEISFMHFNALLEAQSNKYISDHLF